MTQTQTIVVDKKSYVLLPKEEYQNLLARAHGVRLPAYAPAKADGSREALGFIGASLARGLIIQRLEAGLTQEQLASRAGLRVETISRLESGKHKPHPSTLHKIDHALKSA